MLLRLCHERIDGVLERREPHPVVDELGPARFEAGLLMVEVTLKAQVLKIRVGSDDGQRSGALIDLATLDADPAVLDHVNATKACSPRPSANLIDQIRW